MDNQTENTALAEETTDAERKWQLVSLLTGILLIAAVAVIGWLYPKTTAMETLRGRLEIENQSLREQLNLAGTQITGLKNEMEAMLNRNTEMAKENREFKIAVRCLPQQYPQQHRLTQVE